MSDFVRQFFGDLRWGLQNALRPPNTLFSLLILASILMFVFGVR
jgi:hypothetical protein